MNDFYEEDEEYEAEIDGRMQSIRTPPPGTFNTRELTPANEGPTSSRKLAMILAGTVVLVSAVLFVWYLLP